MPPFPIAWDALCNNVKTIHFCKILDLNRQQALGLRVRGEILPKDQLPTHGDIPVIHRVSYGITRVLGDAT
jgi:hypothetical protein